MPRYVADASVIVKWILSGEPYQENAVRLKEDVVSGVAELCAPSFVVEEVAKALWRAIKLERISREDAQEALKALNDMRIELYELDWFQISEGLSVACNLDLTIYDTSYLFLADKMKARFVTADKRVYETAKEHFRVLHVKDYL